MRREVVVAALILVALVLSACSSRDDETVLVMAAASLASSFAEIEAAFEAQHPDVDVQLNLAGSASLREQILQGAPGDVFASANVAIMQLLADADAVAAATVFATNELALAVPADNPGQVTSIDDLERDELLVGLCAPGVPCGDFARQALDQAAVSASIDTNERNVRSLVTKISEGELDAGIVYATDVIQSQQLVQVALPASIDVDVRYPITSISQASNPTGADQFIAFVLSPDGQSILRSFGFGAP